MTFVMRRMAASHVWPAAILVSGGLAIMPIMAAFETHIGSVAWWVQVMLPLVIILVIGWWARSVTRPVRVELERADLIIHAEKGSVRLPLSALVLRICRWPTQGPASGTLLLLACGETQLHLFASELCPAEWVDANLEAPSSYDWALDDGLALARVLRERYGATEAGVESYVITLTEPHWKKLWGGALSANSRSTLGHIAVENDTIALLRGGRVVEQAATGSVSALPIWFHYGEWTYPGLSLRFPGGSELMVGACELGASIPDDAFEVPPPDSEVGPAELALLQKLLR